MVRFLRNAMVAKVAGAILPCSRFRRRSARVGASPKSSREEDLTRFLQIMLRTHTELGYKQEQRFHLELGLLKMVHAQRLLPLEQMLSDAPATQSKGGELWGKPSQTGTPRTVNSCCRAKRTDRRQLATAPIAV